MLKKEKQTTIKKRGTSRYVFFVLHIRVPLCFTFFISIFIELGKGEQKNIKAKSEASIHLGHSWLPLQKKTKEFLIC